MRQSTGYHRLSGGSTPFPLKITLLFFLTTFAYDDLNRLIQTINPLSGTSAMASP
jgi:hypothetical protein